MGVMITSLMAEVRANLQQGRRLPGLPNNDATSNFARLQITPAGIIVSLKVELQDPLAMNDDTALMTENIVVSITFDDSSPMHHESYSYSY